MNMVASTELKMHNSTSYTFEDKLLWMVGALERLATLGLLDSNVPLNVSSNVIDRYLNLDENRNDLFEDDYEVVSCLVGIIRAESDPIPSDEEIAEIAELLMQYKNNREEVVRYALH